MKRDEFQNPSLGTFLSGLQKSIAVNGRMLSDKRLFKLAHIRHSTYEDVKKG